MVGKVTKNLGPRGDASVLFVTNSSRPWLVVFRGDWRLELMRTYRTEEEAMDYAEGKKF